MQKLALSLAILCLVAAMFNVWASRDIATKRRTLGEKQAELQEARQLSQINDQLIRALANSAAATDDAAIREMLASEGVTYQVNAPAIEDAGADEADDDEDESAEDGND